MKTLLATVAVVSWVAASVGFGAEQTFTGVIADSICRGVHKLMAEQVTPPLSDTDCTKTCVEVGGTYVFVDGAKKVLAITNQGFAGLRDHAGQRVKLTGEVKGESITVSRIESAGDAK
jgi:hypothetical protein